MASSLRRSVQLRTIALSFRAIERKFSFSLCNCFCVQVEVTGANEDRKLRGVPHLQGVVHLQNQPEKINREKLNKLENL
ncbi:MAG: hypothetical protein JWQ09_2493 [Segetibacter sp.]|nr:hypothetical protein [Segetibacter sp.]